MKIEYTLFLILAFALDARAGAVSCEGSGFMPTQFLSGNCTGGFCAGFLPGGSVVASGACSDGSSFSATGFVSGGFVNGQCVGGFFSAFAPTQSIFWSALCSNGGQFEGSSFGGSSSASGSCSEN